MQDLGILSFCRILVQSCCQLESQSMTCDIHFCAICLGDLRLDSCDHLQQCKKSDVTLLHTASSPLSFGPGVPSHKKAEDEEGSLSRLCEACREETPGVGGDILSWYSTGLVGVPQGVRYQNPFMTEICGSSKRQKDVFFFF